MRFTMPAFRTQADADSAFGEGTALAASTLSASTFALSTAQARSAAFSLIHEVLLLVYAVYPPAASSTAPAATGHGEVAVSETAA